MPTLPLSALETEGKAGDVGRREFQAEGFGPQLQGFLQCKGLWDVGRGVEHLDFGESNKELVAAHGCQAGMVV